MYPSPLLSELLLRDRAAASRHAEQTYLLRAARAEALSLSQQQSVHQTKRSWWLKGLAARKQVGALFSPSGISACCPGRLSCVCTQ